MSESVREANEMTENNKVLNSELTAEKSEKEAKITMYKDIIDKMKKQQEEDRESALANKVEIGEP